MPDLSTSVLIASFARPGILVRCLQRLAVQITLPDEVIVIWQGDDRATAETVDGLRATLPYPLRLTHCPEVGIVPAENAGLKVANGEVLLLIDDDAVAPNDWMSRHLEHYADPTVGAVGGPANNYGPDGMPFPKHTPARFGRLTWFGRVIGNMFDHVEEWRGRPPQEVDHLVGYNLSLRRAAFDRFEADLKRYWQFFEMDACLQVRANGYRVRLDFANVVEHHPTNSTYVDGREGQLDVKVYHYAYNHAFILGKHSPLRLRPWRLLYLLLVGSVVAPGLLACPVAMVRYGQPWRELGILWTTLCFRLAGWRAGAKKRG